MTWWEVGPLYPEAADTSADLNGTVHAFETPDGTMFFYSGADGTIFSIGVSTLTPASDFQFVNNHGPYAFCL